MLKLIDYQPKKTLQWSARFSLICLVIGYGIAFRYFQSASLPTDLLGLSYLSSAFLGHFGLLAILLWALVCAPLALLLPNQKIARILITLILGSSLLLLAIDTAVFQQYRFHLNLFVWNLIINDTNNEIFQFSLLAKAITSLIAIVVLTILFYAATRLWQASHKRFAIKRYFFGIAGIYLCSQLLHVWADAQYIQSITKYNQYLPVYYPTTAHKFMAKQGWLNEAAQKANQALTVNQQNTSIQYPLKPLVQVPPTAPYNILMVVIDSWRGDEMNAKVSPNMYQFSENALRYEEHYSGSNSTRTGIFSLFYGLPGVYWDAMFANTQSPVLMDTLQAMDYDLGIFASAGLVSPEFDRTVFSQVKNLRSSSIGNSPAARDQNITDEWLQWLEQQQTGSTNPFFGFLFYDAPHGYSIPADYDSPFQPETGMNYLALSPTYDPTQVRNRYRNSVHFDDALIGKVLADIKSRQLLDNTIVIITADHGQEFNDNKHNYWGHGSNFSRAQTHVPMILHWPNKTSQVITRRSSHFSVVPTLMKEAFGVTSADTDYSTGGNLFSTNTADWSIAGSYQDFAIIEKDTITVSGFSGRYQVYDQQMNEMDQAVMNVESINQAMREMRRFYKD